VDTASRMHTPEPLAGTFRTAEGNPADLFDIAHYPVRAVCRVCQQAIRADNFIRPFEHVADG
jgi:hypothetical protein